MPLFFQVVKINDRSMLSLLFAVDGNVQVNSKQKGSGDGGTTAEYKIKNRYFIKPASL
jgi:hypothetical protein